MQCGLRRRNSLHTLSWVLPTTIKGISTGIERHFPVYLTGHSDASGAVERATVIWLSRSVQSMIKGAPMLGESALAHEARRRYVVGARHQEEHFAWMRAELGVISGDAVRATDPEILARATGMSTHGYAVKHTLLANFMVAAPADECQLFGSAAIAWRTKQFGMRVPRKRALVRHACIDVDFAIRQFGSFRRSHQLVCVDWCEKHQADLHQVVSSASSMAISASTWPAG